MLLFFFFNDTATTEIYTLSLHDALPIFEGEPLERIVVGERAPLRTRDDLEGVDRIRVLHVEGEHVDIAVRLVLRDSGRSEEHTSELQSRQYLVCRLLLEKKKKTSSTATH